MIPGGPFLPWVVAAALQLGSPALPPAPAGTSVAPSEGGTGTSALRWPGQGHPTVEAARHRIMKRESRGDYTVADRSRRWFGAYQLSQATANAAARRMDRPDLVDLPANAWTPEEQDAAFYVLYDNGKGAGHWHLKQGRKVHARKHAVRKSKSRKPHTRKLRRKR